MKTNLEKLEKLCEIVNTRYLSGKNDDDQVRAMFNFEKEHSDVRVIIGFNDYKAISVEQYNHFYINAVRNGMILNEYGANYFNMDIDGKRYKCLIKN